MIKRTVFYEQTYKDSPYDYMHISYEKAIDILKEKEDTGVVTTMKDIKNDLECDTDTALAVMGYMHNNRLLKRINGTEYMYDFRYYDKILESLRLWKVYDYDWHRIKIMIKYKM